MRPTIKDVAKLSGFSISTVSLVLNNKDGEIPLVTREKVLLAARELNYRPNRLAVSLVTRRSNILGLIVPDSSNQFFARLGREIENEARRCGYSLILGNSQNDPARDTEYIQVFTDSGVDGVLLAKSDGSGTDTEGPALDYLFGNHVPFVMVDRYCGDPRVTTVMLDHFQGGYLGTKHLLALGHRRIGCVTGPRSLQTSCERVRGYKAALAEAGVPCDEALLIVGDYQIDGGYHALKPLLAQKATAVFAGNDLMAFGIYQAARELGVDIPGALSVMGFDATLYCRLVSPPLTSVFQPVEDIAREAVRQLVMRINAKDAPPPVEHKLFLPAIIPGGSAVPPHSPSPS